MATKQQPIRVKVSDLITAIQAAKGRHDEQRKALLVQAGLAKAEKAAEAEKQAKVYVEMSVEDFAASDYRFKSKLEKDFDRQIAILGIAADEVIAIDAGSDLASYL